MSKRKPVSRKPNSKPSAQRWLETLREPLMFLTGLGLTIFEAVTRGTERSGLLIVYMGMMGLPVVLGSDLLRRKNGNGNGH